MKVEVGRYVYMDRPPMKISGSECLATESYSQLLSVETRQFPIVKVSPATMTIEKDGICNAGSVNHATVAPEAMETPTPDNRTKGNEENAK